MLTADQVITLLVLAVTLVALVREWLPMGMVGVLAPLTLVVTGVIQPGTMWSGLANSAVITVAAMFVVSAAVSRTGALGFVGDRLAAMGATGERRLALMLMLPVALLSAFINNTTVVLVFIPLVLGLCERLQKAPSSFMIPLSFASIFGGMATLIGTSTNIIVANEGAATVERAYSDGTVFDPGMWTFSPMGVVFLVAGLAYMALVGTRMLPVRVALPLSLERGRPREYVTEVEIPEHSSLVGKPLGEFVRRFDEVRVLQLIRGDVIRTPQKDEGLRAGDVLLVKGPPGRIVELDSHTRDTQISGAGGEDVRARTVDATLAEVIIPPGSRWVGRTVSDIGFRARYNVSVMAVQRHGHHIRQKVGGLRVEPSDVVLVQGSVDSLRQLRRSDNLILVEGVGRRVKLKRRAPVALAGLALFVLIASMGWLDTATAGVLIASLLVLGRCLTLQEAFDAVDWNVMFILAGSLVLGRAVHACGLDSVAADGLHDLLGGLGPGWALAVFFGVTAFLTDAVSNGAAAALMIPVVVESALRHGVDPEPFLMAVAFGASAAFLTPYGYQTNLLVYSPGGYRFRDFVAVGLPLRLLFWVLAALLLPVFHPF